MTIIGLITTYLFQRIAKRDNNLRQRGRYLVPLQAYVGIVFFASLYIYQAFKYRVPCLVLYYGSYFGLIPYVLFIAGRAWRLLSRFERNTAIYQSRFAEPADLAALSRTQTRLSSGEMLTNVDSTSTPHSSVRTSVSPSETLVPSSPDQKLQHVEPQNEKLIELTNRSLEEIARSKRWYSWYRTATDKDMQKVAVLYMLASTIIAICFQVYTPMMSFDPIHFECHSGAEYFFPYANVFVFIFLVSPYIIYQLKGINDGFGIRKELIFIVIFSIPCIVLYFVFPAFAPEFTRKVLDRTTWMAMILITGHITSVIMPLVYHYRTHPCNARALARQKMSNRFRFGTDSKENIPMEGQCDAAHDPARLDQVQSSGHGVDYNSHEQGTLDDDDRKNNNTNNINLTIRNLIRNQTRGFGWGQAPDINSKKTDWAEFIRVLEDRILFDKLSAFTVREFCAENTRFLYEVSRLEKRARQYEHLRGLSTDHTDGTTPEKNDGSTGASASAAPADNRHSVVGPLPNHFTKLAKVDTSQPHRIKKIVSASSVSSTQPILATRRSSSSIFDGSEPSSPGSPPRPSLLQYGSGSTVIEYPDSPSSITGPECSLQMDIVDASNTPFAPLPMPPTLLTQFEYVYKSFIKRGSRLELNLSYDTSKEVHEKAKRGDWRSGMFDGAIYEVQDLLFRDVWPKFVTSSHGLNYSGTSTPTDPAHMQEIGAASGPSSHVAAKTAATSRLNSISLYPSSSSDPQSSSRIAPLPTAQMAPSKSSLSRGGSGSADANMPSASGGHEEAVGRSGSSSSKTSKKRHEDDEPSRLGFKAWLTKTSRTGLTAAALVSCEGDTEEARGIIEQSRKSMAARRSDTSGLSQGRLPRQ
ncbi:hypothetical protein BGX31_008362 [Mortierella sp. GBA43]|nr:hypothetical protein BGX31_008362 [Mortierella sp. GBA43]